MHDRAPRNHAPGTPHQELKEAKFGAAQRNLLAASPDLMARRIQNQVAYLKYRGARRRPPARNRSKPREELLEGKRLRHVVVSADVEPFDDVGHGVSRGEDQDR